MTSPNDLSPDEWYAMEIAGEAARRWLMEACVCAKAQADPPDAFDVEWPSHVPNTPEITALVHIYLGLLSNAPTP